MKTWQRKYQRDIEKRLAGAWRTDWARSLCQLLLWWEAKYPMAISTSQREQAKGALEAIERGRVWKLSIDRTWDGFKLESSSSHSHITVYYHITTRGLPPVPTSYREEITL